MLRNIFPDVVELIYGVLASAANNFLFFYGCCLKILPCFIVHLAI